jgi:uncharacterized protein YdhG (YjbR/CyaY superfamily)
VAQGFPKNTKGKLACLIPFSKWEISETFSPESHCDPPRILSMTDLQKNSVQRSPPKKTMKKPLKPKNVDAYIAAAPKEVQSKLQDLRAAIKTAAPKAEEQISYGMPYYGYKGRLAYFAYAKHHIGLYAMPPIVRDHAKELRKYKTATATIRFPLNEKLPIALIKKLVRVGVRNNEARAQKKK